MLNTTEIQRNVLFSFCLTLDTAQDLEALLAHMLRVLADKLSTTQAAATIQDLDGGGGPVTVTYGANRQDSALSEIARARIYRSARPFVLMPGADEPMFPDRAHKRRIDKTSVTLMGAPVFLDGQPVGLITVNKLFGPDVPLEEDMDFMGMIAAIASKATALERTLHKRERDLLSATSTLRAQRPGESISLKDIERHEVLNALERHNWIQSRAARELGITQRQMGYRVKKFHLQPLITERRRALRTQ